MPESPTQPLRVLIIDDHASFRSAVRELLERRGFAVVAEADDATSGLETAERIAPEAVLLDAELAVLLVSSDDIHRNPAHIHECGARGFLLKSRLASSDLVAILARDGDS
jgi:DNA-binding NarL/FixJ family response regulator